MRILSVARWWMLFVPSLLPHTVLPSRPSRRCGCAGLTARAARLPARVCWCALSTVQQMGNHYAEWCFVYSEQIIKVKFSRPSLTPLSVFPARCAARRWRGGGSRVWGPHCADSRAGGSGGCGAGWAQPPHSPRPPWGEETTSQPQLQHYWVSHGRVRTEWWTAKPDLSPAQPARPPSWVQMPRCSPRRQRNWIDPFWKPRSTSFAGTPQTMTQARHAGNGLDSDKAKFTFCTSCVQIATEAAKASSLCSLHSVIISYSCPKCPSYIIKTNSSLWYIKILIIPFVPYIHHSLNIFSSGRQVSLTGNIPSADATT